jgi:hypothetical protein
MWRVLAWVPVFVGVGRATDKTAANQCEEIVARYRKIILLMDRSSKLDPAVEGQRWRTRRGPKLRRQKT